MKDIEEDWLPEHGFAERSDSLKELHSLSFRNRELVDIEKNVSCFHCFSYLPPSSIVEWTDNDQTAVCPKCGIDSLLPGLFSSTILNEMYVRFFTA